MTRPDFSDHHDQVNGRLNESPSHETTPLACYQAHFFDASYPNSDLAQPVWSGHDDRAEFLFEDAVYLSAVFGSDHTKSVVAPDGPNFNDFAAAIAMLRMRKSASELRRRETPKCLPQHGVCKPKILRSMRPLQQIGSGCRQSVKDVAPRVVANTAILDNAGVLKYFTGQSAPSYWAEYQGYLNDRGNILAFNQARVELENEMKRRIIVEPTFVVFDIRSVVLDRTRDVRSSVERQLQLQTRS